MNHLVSIRTNELYSKDGDDYGWAMCRCEARAMDI
jgi:hypothetical protein